MGYLTTFKLSWSGNFDVKSCLSLTDWGFSDENLEIYDKWYSCQDDMIQISQQYPDVLFTLSGVGDDPNDQWIEYYQNGKSQYCHAKITFEPYDVNKMIKN